LPDNVYRVIEIVGTSPEGTDAAIRAGLERAGSTLHGLDWFQVVETRGHVTDGGIQHFQVTLKVGFHLDQ
jgi:flavin-binding protein dodecin